MLLEGDVIVLAGGTGRVGGAVLAALVREGATVGLISRTKESAERTVQTHAADRADRVAIITADLAEPGDAQRAVRECVARFGRIDGLANLSGRGKFVAVAESTLEDLRFNLDGFTVTNYNIVMAVLRQMLAQEPRPGARSRGRLLTVTAGSSKTPQPRFGLMGAAKAAVNTFMLAVAREHKGDGIVANALVLGGVATEAVRATRDPADFAASSSPAEVGDSIAFLVSDRATGINGDLIDHNAREVD